MAAVIEELRVGHRVRAPDLQDEIPGCNKITSIVTLSSALYLASVVEILLCAQALSRPEGDGSGNRQTKADESPTHGGHRLSGTDTEHTRGLLHEQRHFIACDNCPEENKAR